MQLTALSTTLAPAPISHRKAQIMHYRNRSFKNQTSQLLFSHCEGRSSPVTKGWPWNLQNCNDRPFTCEDFEDFVLYYHREVASKCAESVAGEIIPYCQQLLCGEHNSIHFSERPTSQTRFISICEPGDCDRDQRIGGSLAPTRLR